MLDGSYTGKLSGKHNTGALLFEQRRLDGSRQKQFMTWRRGGGL